MGKEEFFKVPYEVLRQRQAYPLDLKVDLSLKRIRHWYDKYAGKVYVAFSGGKDSTVLLYLVRSICPDVPGVFVDTGLEYPEIREFVKRTENVTVLRPSVTFKHVLDTRGYPVISKMVARAVSRIKSPGTSERVRDKALHGDEKGSFGTLPQRWHFLLDAPFPISDRCCEVMKVTPVMKYHRETGRASIIGTMAVDSMKRKFSYVKHGCFRDDISLPVCTPMAFWTEKDVWDYISQNNVPYCSVYNTGLTRTGCMFCLFGIHKESRPNRFDLMKDTHPAQYRYCMEKLGLSDVLKFLKPHIGILRKTPLVDRRIVNHG